MPDPQKFHVQLPSGEEFEVELPGEVSAKSPMRQRASGVGHGIDDLLGLSNDVEAGKLIGDIAKQKVAGGYKGIGGTIADNLSTVKDVVGGSAEAALGMAKGLGSMAWKLAKPVAPWDAAGAQEKMAALKGLDPAATTAPENPIEARWRRGTNLAGMLVLNKAMPWSKEGAVKRAAEAAAKQAAIEDAYKAFSAVGEPLPGAAAKAEAKMVARGLGAPPPKVVPPGGGVTATEQITKALREGIEEGKAAPVQAGELGKHLPPPPFSLGARAAPEQPRVGIPEITREFGAKGEAEAAEAAAKGATNGPKLNTVEAPTKPPGSKPAYNGPERRGLNRVVSAVEDKAYAQVRAAQARKAALGRATAMLTPEGKGTLAKTAAKIEGETAAGAGAGGGKVNLPVASPAEAAPIHVEMPDIKKKVQTWTDKWKSLTGKQRTDFGRNIPSDVRQAMEDSLNQRGLAAPQTRDALGMGPLKKPTLVGSPTVPQGVGGMTKGAKTLTLEDMVAKYGEEVAAQRSGMDVTELRARIKAGGDPAKLEAILKQEIGGQATGRMLGMPVESSGRLPKQAVERLKAAADKEIAETGQMSQRTAEGLARAAREEKELGGFTAFGGFPNVMPFVREHPLIAGGAAGGALGYAMSPEDASGPESLGDAALGAAGGAGLAAAATNLPKVLRGAMAARREGFLSGGAIAKNIGTAAGAPIHIATDVGAKQGLSAAKEMFNLPKNVSEFVSSLKEGTGHPDYAGPNFGRYSPSNVIGAIDKTATKALQRAGISKDDIERVLLTKERSMFTGTNTLTKNAKEASRFVLPFQRVPWNVFQEGIEEMGHMWGDFKTAHDTIAAVAKGDLPLSQIKQAVPSVRSAADVGALAAGYGLGEWAGNDPKNKYVLSILLSAFGPRQALGIMGAVAGLGKQGLAAGAVGGISPIPEQAFDLRALLGVKPAAASAYEKLSGNKIEF